jgi:lauroyl/myristoyl acyltransferase
LWSLCSGGQAAQSKVRGQFRYLGDAHDRPVPLEHSIRRDNLRAAFPQKSAAEIERILSGVRDNLGRFAIEFAHLDDFCLANIGPQTPDAITFTPEVKNGPCWSTSTMPEALR